MVKFSLFVLFLNEYYFLWKFEDLNKDWFSLLEKLYIVKKMVNSIFFPQTSIDNCLKLRLDQ